MQSNTAHPIDVTGSDNQKKNYGTGSTPASLGRQDPGYAMHTNHETSSVCVSCADQRRHDWYTADVCTKEPAGKSYRTVHALLLVTGMTIWDIEEN